MMRGVVTAVLVSMFVVAGCGQPPAPEAADSRPPPIAVTPAIPISPALAAATPGTPTVASAWELGESADSSGVEEIGGRSIEAADEGPWKVRRPAARAGADDGDWGGLGIGSAEGYGGLGLIGTGRGGGGTGEGTIGLGSIGTIGKGGGGGSGSGYGRGAGAASRKSAPRPKPSAAPAPARELAAEPMRRPSPKIDKTPLRAGSTDDNAKFKDFLAYLDATRKKLGQAFQELDVAGRVLVRAVDERGDPIPGAKVSLVDAHDRELWRATAYGDGWAPIYPRLALHGQDTQGLRVAVSAAGARETQPWPGDGRELRVRLPLERKLPPVVVEVLFVIDTTGSMSDEIAQIKASLLAVTDRIRGLDQQAELRYGAVLYRDLTDQYVTMTHPFTADIKAFDAALREIDAGGGGDYPESVNQGLAQAVLGMQWQPHTAKVAFLIGDAPPHMDYKGDVLYGESAVEAIARGIRVHAVAASGLDPLGSVVFRQIAQLTRGKFIFIEYGKDLAGSAAKHGVGGRDLGGNNLDAIIFNQIRDEITGWGAR